MRKLNTLDWIALVLLIVGGLNWGLWGLFEYDLVAELLGGGDSAATLPKIVYILVGLSAIWVAIISASLEKKGE
jgi:uncharacterized membrane protein YuzA (DUF378 family)